MALVSVFNLSVGIIISLMCIYILFISLESTQFFQDTKNMFASPNCQTDLQNSLGKVGSAILCTLFKDFTLLLVMIVILFVGILFLYSIRKIFREYDLDFI